MQNLLPKIPGLSRVQRWSLCSGSGLFGWRSLHVQSHRRIVWGYDRQNGLRVAEHHYSTLVGHKYAFSSDYCITCLSIPTVWWFNANMSSPVLLFFFSWSLREHFWSDCQPITTTCCTMIIGSNRSWQKSRPSRAVCSSKSRMAMKANIALVRSSGPFRVPSSSAWLSFQRSVSF